MSLRWEKKLSKSDAQVKTGGWPVPYIRLTRSGHSSDTQTWFRHTFFSGVSWKPGHFGDHAVEQAMVGFDVKLPGQSAHSRKLMITHDGGRGQTGKVRRILGFTGMTSPETNCEQTTTLAAQLSWKEQTQGRFY